MNKVELQEAIFKKVTTRKENPLSISKNDVSEVVDNTITVVIDALKDGQSIALRGFGTFEVTQTAARTARNPRTGEMVQVPAKKKAKFRPSGNLQTQMNE